MKHLVEWELAEETYLKETSCITTLPHHKSHMNWNGVAPEQARWEATPRLGALKEIHGKCLRKRSGGDNTNCKHS
jgi:hypothetical protein